MKYSFLIFRLLISGFGISLIIMLIPLIVMLEDYYRLQESLSIDPNLFAGLGLLVSFFVFYFLFKYGDKYFSSIIFSFFYYFFVPIGLIQLLFFDSYDGQVAFALFPVFIICSILLFFILNLFRDKN